MKSRKWFRQSVNILSEWLRNPGTGLWGREIQNFSLGSMLPGPPPCAFGARLGNRPVFNVDSRLRFRFGCCNTLQEVICFVLWFFLAPSGSGQYHQKNRTFSEDKIDLSVAATLVDGQTQVKDTVRCKYSIELQVKLLIKSSFSPSTIASSRVVSHDLTQRKDNNKAKECITAREIRHS